MLLLKENINNVFLSSYDTSNPNPSTSQNWKNEAKESFPKNTDLDDITIYHKMTQLALNYIEST
jgi:hypothetical protein